MSRTKKGSKSLGYDYWSKRPFNKNGGCIGPFAKKRTHKAERQLNKPDKVIDDNECSNSGR